MFRVALGSLSPRHRRGHVCRGGNAWFLPPPRRYLHVHCPHVGLTLANLPAIWGCSSSRGKRARAAASTLRLDGPDVRCSASAVAPGRLMRTGAAAPEANASINWWPELPAPSNCHRGMEPLVAARSAARPEFPPLILRSSCAHSLCGLCRGCTASSTGGAVLRSPSLLSW